MKNKFNSILALILNKIIERSMERIASAVANQSYTAYRWQCMPDARVPAANSKKFEKGTVQNYNFEFKRISEV